MPTRSTSATATTRASTRSKRCVKWGPQCQPDTLVALTMGLVSRSGQGRQTRDARAGSADRIGRFRGVFGRLLLYHTFAAQADLVEDVIVHNEVPIAEPRV